jgi:hypothetical protein
MHWYSQSIRNSRPLFSASKLKLFSPSLIHVHIHTHKVKDLLFQLFAWLSSTINGKSLINKLQILNITISNILSICLKSLLILLLTSLNYHRQYKTDPKILF